MPEEKITLNIDGPKVTASKLLKGMQAFYALLIQVTDSVSHKKNSIQWLAAVKSGSNLLELMPTTSKDIDDATLAQIDIALIKGIKMLEDGIEDRPAYFSDEALEAAKELSRILDTKSGTINTVEIRTPRASKRLSTQSAASVDKILGGKYEAIGSVEGNLEMISQRNEFHCNVWDALTDKRVRCYLDIQNPVVKKKVFDAFGKRVAVYGRVRYRKDGTPESIAVSDIRIFKNPNELPPIDEYKGLFKK